MRNLDIAVLAHALAAFLLLLEQLALAGDVAVDGTASSWIGLSEGAVVLPAACLLRETQRVTLAQFERR